MSNSSSAWNWDSPRRQPADPSASALGSPWNNDFEQISNAENNSPWNDDYEIFEPWNDFEERALTLAPINPENSFDNLPSLSPGLFDVPSRLSTASDDPFLTEPSFSQNQPPPPSNEQARVRREPFPSPPPRSQYFLEDADSPDPFEQFSNLTPPPNMPPSNHTRSSSFVDLTASSPIQSRSEPAPSRKRKAESPGEGRPSKSGKTLLPPDPDAVELVDLADVDNLQELEEKKARDLAEAIKAQNQAEATKPMKLAEFKCIICMDDPTDLTVTHCGHLFCSECLHQALHAGDRKCCPVCRTPIVVPRAGQKPTAKAYFPLSMKLTTAKKHGKRAIRA